MKQGQRFRGVVVIVSLSIVAFIAAGYIIPLLIRSTYRFQLGYNEGWMAYHVRELATGHRFYGQPPGYASLNYPPLAFYVINTASRFTGDPIAAGRAVASIALLLTAIFAGAVVFAMTRAGAPALLASLLLAVSLARYAPDYVGVDDAQLLGDAFLMFGVLMWVLRPSPEFTAASAITVGTALFIKHNMLAFPAAIAAVLFFQNRRRWMLWMSMLLGTALIWTGFCLVFQGQYLFHNIFLPRMVRNVRAPMSFMIFVNAMQLPFVAALLWMLLDRAAEYWSWLAATFGLALLYALYASRGDGTWVNHWFDLLFIVCIIASVAWARIARFWMDANWPRPWIPGLVPVMLVLGFAAQEALPRGLMGLSESRQQWAAAQSRFQADVEYERSHSGPAICENLSLCYYAGKAFDYDPFTASQRILNDPATAAPIVRDLEMHRYGTVQINAAAGDLIPARDRALFPIQFMQALLANYHIDRQNQERVFFVPNGQPLAD